MRLLRNVVPMKNFVGRYGGDEFVVVICDTSKEEVENILNQLQEEVYQFNRYGRNETISYAYGWAFSKDCTDCTLGCCLIRLTTICMKISVPKGGFKNE